MTISIDYGNTNIIDVELADLAFVSGTFYTFDSDAFRLTLKDLEDDEIGQAFPDTHRHVPADTIAGATDSKKIIILAPYSVRFPDSQISIQVIGSNNNIHDVGAGILVQNQAQVITTNSFGLVTVVSGSGVTQQDKDDIENQIFARIVENGESFEVMMRLLRAAAAGNVVQAADGSYAIRDAADSKDRITGDDAVNGGRSITAVDGV